MDFKFSNMYDFYRAFGEPTDDAFVHMYVAAEGAPYAKHAMQVRRVPTGDNLDCETGTFIMTRAEDYDGCKRLYVIQPRLHDEPRILSGDHLSFKYDEDAGVRLRKTYYFPSTDVPTLGYMCSDSNFIPAQFVMSDDVDKFKDIMSSDTLKVHGTFLHDLMTRHITEPAAMSVPACAEGDTAMRVPAFDKMWQTLPIKRIMVVGVRNGDGFDVTVFVFPSLKPGNSSAMYLRAEAERDFRDDIADRYKNYRWDSFKWYPDADDFGIDDSDA
jgi:hypothetical protein